MAYARKRVGGMRAANAMTRYVYYIYNRIYKHIASRGLHCMYNNLRTTMRNHRIIYVYTGLHQVHIEYAVISCCEKSIIICIYEQDRDWNCTMFRTLLQLQMALKLQSKLYVRSGLHDMY